MDEEKSVFVQLFGDYPAIKVIDFLLTFREFDYPLTEIAENSGVAWSTIHSIFPSLLKLGVVRQTRKLGRAKLYKLNSQNKIATELINLENKLIHELAEESVLERVVAKNKVKNH